MDKIDAKPKTLSELLNLHKYSVDYYQREYKWETQHIAKLLEDLERRFLESYDESHERFQVEKYAHYFIGDIIISSEDDKKFIIDGQQRLTSLTLLLIYIHHKIKEQSNEDSNDDNVNNLIASIKYGKWSFNIDVPERVSCLKALYEGENLDTSDQSESIINIVARYNDIEERFPDTLKGKALLYFKDWLINNLDIVEITAYSNEDAYIIFETMNDRGLNLTPTEMLKGYLLGNIKEPDSRIQADSVWKKTIKELSELEKNDESDFFKAWLRSKYAKTIRARQKDSTNLDFEAIATNYYKWIRDEKDAIGLVTNSEFIDFIENKFAKFSKYYIRIRRAAETLTQGLEYVFYNAHNKFTLQYPLLLAPLCPEDDVKTVDLKINLVAGYIDNLVIHRVINSRTLEYNAMSYMIFNLIKEIRDLDVETLAYKLKTKANEMPGTLDKLTNFSLIPNNKRFVHHILARITDHIQQQCGQPTSFPVLVNHKKSRDPYEIEHIWADKYERHKAEFEQPEAFSTWRNYLGGLLLLPRSFNKSFGDKIYEKKLEAYFGQNLLAQSLNQKCYQNNPQFIAYIERTRLPFKAHPEFNKQDLLERTNLYERLFKDIWNLSRFDIKKI
jgi:uncharacterized protein with ParB-like and HNH nuclease domain